MKGNISIPPVPEFREHITAVLMMLDGYYKAVEAEVLPATPKSQRVINILSPADLQELKDKFDAAPPDEKVPMTAAEAVRLSACYLLLSHLLISEEGEKLFALMYAIVPDDGSLDNPGFYDFPTIRNRILIINDHLIINSEAQISDAEGYAEMKAQIAALIA